MELNDYYEKYDKEKEEMLNYLETDFDELFKDDEKEIEEVKKFDIEKAAEIEKATNIKKAEEIAKRKSMEKEVKQYKKIRKGFRVAFNNFIMSDAELEKAENRREIVDLKINKIVQNRKKDLPQEDNKKAEAKKEENEDSDEEGKVNQSIYKNQQMTKYSKESETKEEIKLKAERRQLGRIINCSLEWLKEIPVCNLTKENIKILAEEINNSEVKLSFQEFSQYNYNYLSKLGKITFDPPRYIARGCYDAKVKLENAGSCFTLSNFPKNVKFPNFDCEIMTLKIARVDFEDQKLKFDPSYLIKFNTTDYGMIDLSEEENKQLEELNKLEKLPFELIDDSIDFKVVKTPISNRTFIIGGKTCKAIKEIYKEDNNIKVKTLKTELSYQFNDDFNIFKDISNIYLTQDQPSIRGEWERSKIVRSTQQVLENLDIMIGKVSSTDVEYWSDRMYRDKTYINKIFESWKPLASDHNSDSKAIAKSMIECTVTASDRLKFEIDDADRKAAEKTFTIDKIEEVMKKIKTESAEELRRTKRKIELFGDDEEDKEETKESTQLDKNTRIKQETTKNLEYYIRDECFIKIVKEYLTNLVETRRDSIIEQLKEIRKKLEYSELETFYPKFGHSVVANKDFVFITGGEHNYMDKSFEILVLKDGEREKQRNEERKTQKDTERLRKRKEEECRRNTEVREEEVKEEVKEGINKDDKENITTFDDTYEVDDIFIYRGPNLKNRRSKHASIIIQNYLYVIFGYVQDGDKPSMSFERIEIPPPNMTKTNIDDFYKSREWEYYEINNSYDWNVYFSCSNCIKTLDNNLVFYGTMNRMTGSFKYVKIVAKLNVQKVSLSISETDLSEWLSTSHEKVDINKNEEEQKILKEGSKTQKLKEHDEIKFCKENVHAPFLYCGEWYLPLSSIQNNNLCKWNEASMKFDLIPDDSWIQIDKDHP